MDTSKKFLCSTQQAIKRRCSVRFQPKSKLLFKLFSLFSHMFWKIIALGTSIKTPSCKKVRKGSVTVAISSEPDWTERVSKIVVCGSSRCKIKLHLRMRFPHFVAFFNSYFGWLANQGKLLKTSSNEDNAFVNAA